MEEIRLYSEEFQKLIDEELKEQALEAKEAEIAEAKREAALEKMEESANNNNTEVEVIGENKETEEN